LLLFINILNLGAIQAAGGFSRRFSDSLTKLLLVFSIQMPIPVATGAPGQQDTAAAKEITEHLTIVGSVPWLGMQGTGQIVYGSKDTTAYSATLSMMEVLRDR